MSAPESEHEELRVKWHLVLNTVRHQPSLLGKVIQDVENESSPFVVKTIKSRFGPAMKWGKRGRSIRRGADVLYRLSVAYSGARKLDRNLLLENAVTELFALVDDEAKLEGIGKAAVKLVLAGTPQQLLITAISIRMGKALELPHTLRKYLAEPFIDALTAILEVGAPAMRDAALEGLGALLKHLDPEQQKPFSLPRLAAASMSEGDPLVNRAYDELRRLCERIVRALSGDMTELAQYRDEFAQPVNKDFARRALLTRALPAMLRHGALPLDVVVECVQKAAAVGELEFDSGVRAQTDAARYQESVFRTIALLIDEPGVDPHIFDRLLARAVTRIPETLLGPLELCNAQARATVAILWTASEVATRLHGSDTDKALKERYRILESEHTEWMNPGIVEGCFRGLPVLLWDHTNDKWTVKALESLFKRLRTAPDFSNYVDMHARLCANAAFRQILLSLNERMHQQFLEFEPNVDEDVRERAVENAMRSLLEKPTPERVLHVFHQKRFEHAGDTPRNVSEIVVSASALETSLLYRSDLLFEEWTRLSDAQQLLLVRILGCQLRAASRERVQIEQYPLVKRVLRRLSSVGIEDIDRDEMLWELLSRIPPRAAEAAETDMQDFVEYRTGHLSDTEGEGLSADVDDLPGYVLAMVSDEVSDQLAGDIARQVNLNLRRTQHQPDFDFADPLYQIMLRNPGPAIYDHLLAQIDEPKFRDLLLLCRDHVIQVRKCMPRHPGEEVKIDELVHHAENLTPRLRWHQSFALRGLGEAMQLYVELAAEKPKIWKAIVGTHDDDRDGGLGALFRALDRLDNETHRRQRTEQPRLRARRRSRRRDMTGPRKVARRAQLAKLCSEECVALRLEIEHYLRLPVGRFEECGRALNLAIAAVRRIREKLCLSGGLQPPEFVILDSLLGRWEKIFDRTLQWYVDAPRRCVHARRKKLFWMSFTNVPKSDLPRADPATEAELSHFHAAGDYSMEVPPETTPALPHVPKPPIPPGQDIAYENFFVEWMASDLDVDHLRWALGRRWQKFGFGAAYRVITSLWRTLIALAIPFALLAYFHWTDQPEIEGVGFLFYIGMLVFFASFAFIERLRDERLPTTGLRRPLFGFRFSALLPRLFRLIVVPLGLLIDFEHSYLFPMHASNIELIALIGLAFVAPHFFIRREVRSREGELSRLDDREVVEDVNRRVRQILSVALSHSFAVALIFSFLFEAKYISRIHVADTVHLAAFTNEAPRARLPVEVVEDLHRHYHHEPYFLGIIPREARCDINVNWLAARFHNKIESPLRFDFYPTLILAWTAIGLFFGVFLEGFLKGEHLRGEIGS